LSLRRYNKDATSPKAISPKEKKWAQKGADLVEKMRASGGGGSSGGSGRRSVAKRGDAAAVAAVSDLAGQLELAAAGAEEKSARQRGARAPVSRGRAAASGAPVAAAPVLALPAYAGEGSSVPCPDMPVMLAPPCFESMERPAQPTARGGGMTRGGEGGGVRGLESAVADAEAVLDAAPEWERRRAEREARQKARKEVREAGAGAAAAAGARRGPLRDIANANVAPEEMTMGRRGDGGGGRTGGAEGGGAGGRGGGKTTAAAAEAGGATGYWARKSSAAAAAAAAAAAEGGEHGNKQRVERVWSVSGDGSDVTVQSVSVPVRGKKL